MRKVIAVDVDGVLCDIHTICIAKINVKFNTMYTVNDITEWDLPTFPPEHREYFLEEIGNPDNYLIATPIYRSKLGIHELQHALGFDIVYVTSCMKGTEGVKFNWLERNDFNPMKGLYFETHNKGEINADILIDDAPHNINSFSNTCVLFDQPWNREYTSKEYIRFTWDDTFKVFYEIQKTRI